MIFIFLGILFLITLLIAVLSMGNSFAPFRKMKKSEEDKYYEKIGSNKNRLDD